MKAEESEILRQRRAKPGLLRMTVLRMGFEILRQHRVKPGLLRMTVLRMDPSTG
jgi:hypothetical protein